MVRFFNKDIKFELKDKLLYKRWIKSVVQEHGNRVGDVNVIFCNDDYILEINNRFLGHDYYTDIITFDYSEEDLINGELYISIDTVMANAGEYNQNFPDELNRVIIHGFLHLCGLDDHSEDDIRLMREAENSSLEKLEEILLSK
ncbi:MAG: rRNA maturation RNase YbeY [Bacteroidales bacterium]|nr:rRNA maturation RNase YbeY [Bacteroidales bacterium]